MTPPTMAPVLSDEPPEVGNDGGGDEGGEGGCGEGGGDGGGLGGGGATTMVTICVVCATVGFTDATVTEAPAEVRELVMTAGVMAAKVCALAATVFIVADSEVGTVILASTLTLPDVKVSSSWQGEKQPNSAAITDLSKVWSIDETSPARVMLTVTIFASASTTASPGVSGAKGESGGMKGEGGEGGGGDEVGGGGGGDEVGGGGGGDDDDDGGGTDNGDDDGDDDGGGGDAGDAVGRAGGGGDAAAELVPAPQVKTSFAVPVINVVALAPRFSRVLLLVEMNSGLHPSKALASGKQMERSPTQPVQEPAERNQSDRCWASDSFTDVSQSKQPACVAHSEL